MSLFSNYTYVKTKRKSGSGDESCEFKTWAKRMLWKGGREGKLAARLLFNQTSLFYVYKAQVEEFFYLPWWTGEKSVWKGVDVVAVALSWRKLWVEGRAQMRQRDWRLCQRSTGDIDMENWGIKGSIRVIGRWTESESDNELYYYINRWGTALVHERNRNGVTLGPRAKVTGLCFFFFFFEY